MLIRCPTCASVYDLAPELVPDGRILRCAHCRDAWVHAAGAVGSAPESPRPDGPEIVTQTRFFRLGAEPAEAGVNRRRTLRRIRPGISAGAAAGLALLTLVGGGWAALAERGRVVAAFPPGEAVFAVLGLPVNLRGLALGDVRSSVEPTDAGAMLTFEGRISNLRPGPTSVPALRIAVRDKHRRELYHWTAPAPKTELARGETVLFHGRLATPPDDGRDIAVGFAEAPEGPRRLAEVLPGDR